MTPSRSGSSEMPARVTATPEALEAIERLTAVHGPLAFFQSGGCYIDSAQDERWHRDGIHFLTGP
jgi:uncharacterized protein (DUF779 family)